MNSENGLTYYLVVISLIWGISKPYFYAQDTSLRLKQTPLHLSRMHSLFSCLISSTAPSMSQFLVFIQYDLCLELRQTAGLLLRSLPKDDHLLLRVVYSDNGCLLCVLPAVYIFMVGGQLLLQLILKERDKFKKKLSIDLHLKACNVYFTF